MLPYFLGLTCADSSVDDTCDTLSESLLALERAWWHLSSCCCGQSPASVLEAQHSRFLQQCALSQM